MKRILPVLAVLAVAAAAVLVVRRDGDPAPPRDVVVRIDAEPGVCWTALLDAGDDPTGEPHRESDCGPRQLPFNPGEGANVAVSKTGEGELSVAVVVNGAETHRQSTADPSGTVALDL